VLFRRGLAILLVLAGTVGALGVGLALLGRSQPPSVEGMAGGDRLAVIATESSVQVTVQVTATRSGLDLTLTSSVRPSGPYVLLLNLNDNRERRLEALVGSLERKPLPSGPYAVYANGALEVGSMTVILLTPSATTVDFGLLRPTRQYKAQVRIGPGDRYFRSRGATQEVRIPSIVFASDVEYVPDADMAKAVDLSEVIGRKIAGVAADSLVLYNQPAGTDWLPTSNIELEAEGRFGSSITRSCPTFDDPPNGDNPESPENLEWARERNRCEAPWVLRLLDPAQGQSVHLYAVAGGLALGIAGSAIVSVVALLIAGVWGRRPNLLPSTPDTRSERSRQRSQQSTNPLLTGAVMVLGVLLARRRRGQQHPSD